ncbi:MAG: hypothetical protein H7101_12615 [Deinococcales bacterium]|nr:hypothetical protein [Chitinophagaceae bacterium]
MIKINTYMHLQNEKQRLKLLLETHKIIIKEDAAMLRETIKPAADVLSVIGKFTNRDKTNPLLNLGVDFGVEVIVKKLLLGRAGWVSKIIIPFIIKNFSSNIFAENKKFGFFNKLLG